MELLLLTSPPASGKTHWIETYSQVGDKILVISPLRALVNECKSKWGDKICIMTPEEWMKTKIYSEIVIFDEFHLLFFWGDTFRPIMWEVFYELSCHAELIIGLTATLNCRNELSLMTTQFDTISWCDLGNFKLKNTPKKYLCYPNARLMKSSLQIPKKDSGTWLIFCRYRDEVRLWESRLRKQGYRVLACVGGEANLFCQALVSCPDPDFIIATTVLSHGVNLPEISRVYFLYSLQCPEFWIQMVARGGRKGELFEVHALEKPLGIKWNPLTNFLAILSLKIRIKIQSARGQWEEWYLKESSQA